MGSFKGGLFFFNFVVHLKSTWRLRCINLGAVCDQGVAESKDFF